MPAIPKSTRSPVTWRLMLHADEHWPQLDKVQVTCRGNFAWAAAILPGGEKVPLFRLRYGGSAHSFGFAIYSAARDRYQDALLLTGQPTGTPQEALDTACTVHLADIGTNPTPDPPRTYGFTHLAKCFDSCRYLPVVAVRGCMIAGHGADGVCGREPFERLDLPGRAGLLGAPR